ncbi:hypothetical protein ANTRET_LOCUS10036 [Anthophora retusa]
MALFFFFLLPSPLSILSYTFLTLIPVSTSSLPPLLSVRARKRRKRCRTVQSESQRRKNKKKEKKKVGRETWFLVFFDLIKTSKRSPESTDRRRHQLLNVLSSQFSFFCPFPLFATVHRPKAYRVRDEARRWAGWTD